MNRRVCGIVLVMMVLALPLPTSIGVAEMETILPIELSGEIDGAAYRIHVPKRWNGTLLVYAHGYSPWPITDPDLTLLIGELEELLLEKGYALAASGFRGAGQTTAEGVEDSEALVRFFEENVAAPDRVILYGVSMGGQVALKSIEVYPDRYDGTIPMCAVPKATRESDLMLDWAVAYNAAFGWDAAWGEIGKVRTDIDFRMLWLNHVLPKVQSELFDEHGAYINQTEWEFIRRVTGTSRGGFYAPESPLMPAPTVLLNNFFATGGIAEIQIRTGGTVQQNVGRVYSLSPRDARELSAMELDVDALLASMNAKTNIEADPDARQALATLGDTTGVISTPVLLAHNLEDSTTPVAETLTYQAMVNAAGAGEWLVRVYTDLPGHCHFTDQQVVTLFEAMEAWLDTGVRPNPLTLPGFVPFHVTHLPLAIRGE